jgi:hypothetical protein
MVKHRREKKGLTRQSLYQVNNIVEVHHLHVHHLLMVCVVVHGVVIVLHGVKTAIEAIQEIPV